MSDDYAAFDGRFPIPMTNPKPLFTAGSFDTGLFDGQPVIDIHEAADIANGIVAPLQAEIERLRADVQHMLSRYEELALKYRREQVDNEKLRAEADDWQIQCGRAAKQASDLRIEIERLREALTQIAKGPGMQTPGVTQADVARAALKGKA